MGVCRRGWSLLGWLLSLPNRAPEMSTVVCVGTEREQPLGCPHVSPAAEQQAQVSPGAKRWAGPVRRRESWLNHCLAVAIVVGGCFHGERSCIGSAQAPGSRQRARSLRLSRG